MQLIGMLGVALLCAMAWWVGKSVIRGEKGTLPMLASNLALVGVIMVVLRFVAPDLSNMLFYRGLYEHFGWAVAGGAALAVFLVGYEMEGGDEGNTNMLWVWGIAGLIVGALALGALKGLRESNMAQNNTFTKIERPIPAALDTVRFTPLEVAYEAMKQKFTESEFDIARSYLHPFDYNGGFGYIAPVEPVGLLNPFLRKSDGFVVYDDNHNTADTNRIKRVHRVQQIGAGMYVRDNLERCLYDADWFAEYPEIYYLQVGTNIVAVAPKVRYSLKWLSPQPYWDGVSLVHSDGKIEQLSVEQAKKDPRFGGKLMFPSKLARRYVQAQRFDQGALSGFLKREGKIEIPDLPGDNQMPYYVKGADGRAYFVVLTEPDGEKTAIFRIFYQDVTTGDRFVFEYPKGSAGLIGPVAAVQLVMQIPGYSWAKAGGHGGTFEVKECVFLSKGERTFWKLSITTMDSAVVALTAVVDAESQELLTFKNSREFFSWLLDQSSAVPISGIDPDLVELNRLALEFTRKFETYRQKKMTPSPQPRLK